MERDPAWILTQFRHGRITAPPLWTDEVMAAGTCRRAVFLNSPPEALRRAEEDPHSQGEVSRSSLCQKSGVISTWCSAAPPAGGPRSRPARGPRHTRWRAMHQRHWRGITSRGMMQPTRHVQKSRRERGTGTMTLLGRKQPTLKLGAGHKTDVRTQFAALCYRMVKDKPQILLITGRRSQ